MIKSKLFWLVVFVFSAVVIFSLEGIGIYLYFTLPQTEVSISLQANEVGLLLFATMGRSTFTGFWLLYSWLKYRNFNKEVKS